jgi:hypothetical protein
MKKRLKMIVAFIVIIQFVLSSVTSSIALTNSGTGESYIYIRTNNFDNLVDSTGEKVIFYDQCGFSLAPDVTTADATYKDLLNLILFKPNATLSYQFDMRDDIQKAVFNLYGGNSNYKVEVKVDGESNFTELAANGSIIGGLRGIIPYNLTTSDALKSANKKFIIKITNSGTSDGLLYAVSVNAHDKETSNSIQVGAFTENEMKYTVADNNIGRCHINYTPSIQLKSKDSYIIYKFNLADDITSLSYSAENFGGDAINLQFSADETNWLPLSGLSGDLTTNIAGLNTKLFYIKCTSDTTSNNTNLQAFISKLSLTVGNAPLDNTVDTYQYIRTNSTNNLYASTGDNLIYYDTSYYGSAPTEAAADDTFKQLLNLILFKPNATLSYQFDLRNDVQDAVLNIYGGNSDFKVEVQADGESSYTELTAKGSVSNGGRGVISYNIDNSNALKAANKKFIVRITNTGSTDGVLYALSVNTFAKETSDSIQVGAFTESEMKYTYANNVVGRYHNGDTPGIQLKTKDSYVVYKFSFADNLSSLLFNTETFGGDAVKLQFSADATNWVPLSGLSGDISSNIAGLNKKSFYIKCMADPNTTNPNNNQAYLAKLTLTAGYTVVDNNVDSYQYIRTNNFDNVYASTGEKVIYYDALLYSAAPAEADASDAFKQLLNTILFKPNASLIFQFDLRNDIQDAVLNIYGGNSSFKVEVQASGEGTYTELTARGSIINRGTISYGIDTTNALKAANKKFIVRITNVGSSDGILYALSVNAFDKETNGSISVGAFTENELKYTFANNTVGRYHNGNNPGIQLKTKDSYIIYKFNFADNLSLLHYTAETFGSDNVLLAFSADASNWVPLNGLTGDISNNIAGLTQKSFYIKCMADPATTNPTNDQAFLSNLSLQAIYNNAGGGIIGTPNGIGDRYKYIRVDDLAKASVFANATISNDTRAGGYGILPSDHKLYEVNNQSMFIDNGGFAEFTFDLADDVNNAILKINGTGLSNVQVRAKDAGEYVNLFAQNTAKGPAVIIFNLTDDDALRNASKEFVVRINGASETVVQSILVQTQNDEINSFNTVVKGTTESEMKYLTDSVGLNRYFDNFLTPTIQMIPSSYMVLNFNFADNLDTLSFDVTYANASTAKFEMSKDNGTTWIDVGTGVSGILDDYIKDIPSKQILIKISPQGDSDVFLTSFSFSAEYEIAGGIPLPTIDFGYNNPLPSRIPGFQLGSVEEDPYPEESLVGGTAITSSSDITTDNSSSETSSNNGETASNEAKPITNPNPNSQAKPVTQGTSNSSKVIFIIIALSVIGILGVSTVLYLTKFKKKNEEKR